MLRMFIAYTLRLRSLLMLVDGQSLVAVNMLKCDEPWVIRMDSCPFLKIDTVGQWWRVIVLKVLAVKQRLPTAPTRKPKKGRVQQVTQAWADSSLVVMVGHPFSAWA